MNFSRQIREIPPSLIGLMQVLSLDGVRQLFRGHWWHLPVALSATGNGQRATNHVFKTLNTARRMRCRRSGSTHLSARKRTRGTDH